MPETLAALVAFVREHQRCGELDSGREGGYVWLACSCGARIVQPEREPPKPEPAATWRATVQPSRRTAICFRFLGVRRMRCRSHATWSWAEDFAVRERHVISPHEQVQTMDPGSFLIRLRTRVCCLPRAFPIRSASCMMLTQHLTPRDSNSAGILVPCKLPPRARGRLKSQELRLLRDIPRETGTWTGSPDSTATTGSPLANRGPATTEIDLPHLRGGRDLTCLLQFESPSANTRPGNQVGIDVGMSWENGNRTRFPGASVTAARPR